MDLDRLAVVAQLDADDAGILRLVKPDPPIDPTRGARVQNTTVQFGLTTDELDTIWARIEALLAMVDDGRIGVF